ncbi:hypothetical protein HNY73_011632, partial [Argiope bruennichi]
MDTTDRELKPARLERRQGLGEMGGAKRHGLFFGFLGEQDSWESFGESHPENSFRKGVCLTPRRFGWRNWESGMIPVFLLSLARPYQPTPKTSAAKFSKRQP